METKKHVKQLLSDSDAARYAGMFVCVKDLDSQEVIAADLAALKALERAKEKGVENPVTFYVPMKGEVFLFKLRFREQERLFGI